MFLLLANNKQSRGRDIALSTKAKLTPIILIRTDDEVIRLLCFKQTFLKRKGRAKNGNWFGGKHCLYRRNFCLGQEMCGPIKVCLFVHSIYKKTLNL